MISLFTTIERDHETWVDQVVDVPSGPDRDVAFQAVCSTGYWTGAIHHADDYVEADYLASQDDPEWDVDDTVWQNAIDAAMAAAEAEGHDHAANHTDD